jgi:hypothetical protein
MKKTLLAAVAGSVILSGCTSMNSKEFASPLSLSSTAIHEPTVQVGEKIKGEASQTIINLVFFPISIGGETEYAEGVIFDAPVASAGPRLPNVDPAAKVKKAAAYNAIQSSGADVIVAPQYKIRETSFGPVKMFKATVEGYKGTITGFKQISVTDLK